MLKNGRNKGSALIMVILFLNVLLVLSSSLMVMVKANHKSEKSEGDELRAFYAAEACLDATRAIVLTRFQEFLNQPKGHVNPGKFKKFLEDLFDVDDLVINRYTGILEADYLSGTIKQQGNTMIFTYMATFAGQKKTLSDEYAFADIKDMESGDRAEEKVEITWKNMG